MAAILNDNEIKNKISKANWKTIPKTTTQKTSAPSFVEYVEVDRDNKRLMRASFGEDTAQIVDFLDRERAAGLKRLNLNEIEGLAGKSKADDGTLISGNHASYINGNEGSITISETDLNILNGKSNSKSPFKG